MSKAQFAAYALRVVHKAERIRWPRIEVRDAVYFLLLLLCFLFLAHYVNSYRDGQQREQAAQRRQGVLVERKLCTTLDRLTQLRPPPGNPATNPSRAFDQKLHSTLGQLGPDLGCR